MIIQTMNAPPFVFSDYGDNGIEIDFENGRSDGTDYLAEDQVPG